MYTFPNKLKNIARVLMILGFIGLVLGFLGAPKNVAEAKAMTAQHHVRGHMSIMKNPMLMNLMQKKNTMLRKLTGKIHTIVLMTNTYYINYKINLGQHSMLRHSSFL